MNKIISKFNVKYLQIIDENGKCDDKIMPKLSNAVIKQMYEYMVLTRAFDDKALKMQRQGRLGTYAPMKGQEACQIGSGFAMDKDDFVFPAFRENGLMIFRGVSAKQLYQYWAGDERGMQIPKNVNVFPIAITVGGHLPHAVGAGMAFKLQKKKAAAIVYFGDGATSEGDFHEAMNFAGVFKTPCVFICQNNQWAISVPVKEQTASETIAQKAIAYGFEGVKVDGNDVFAVYSATLNALKKARTGNGPTLIECFTYRLADHTTSDDAKKYREDKEVKKWEKKDPILRLEKYMKNKNIADEKYFADVRKKAESEIETAVQEMEKAGRYEPEEIFNYLYKELTQELKEQKEKAIGEFATIKEEMKGVPQAQEMGFGKAKEKGMGVVGELEEA